MAPKWAGFWIRGLTFFADLILLNLLYLFLGLMGKSAMRISLDAIYLEFPSPELVQMLLMLYFLTWLPFFCAYFIFFHGYGGQTPAKMLFKVKVLTKGLESLPWRKAFIRTFGYFISGLFLFGLGFLMVLLHPQKRALHDLLAGTIVVRDRRT